jgi:hypothetical protein
MNEINLDNFERDNFCETRYFDNIISILNNYISDYSIVVTIDHTRLPETKYKKIVFLIGEPACAAGKDIYSNYSDIVAIFREYCDIGHYDNKRIFPIPIGYNCRSNGKVMERMYPEKPISERKYDIFYSGQPLPWRKSLVDTLEGLRMSFNIWSEPTTGFRQGLDIDDYYRTMGDSKICVCPDGTAPDTYRFTEACGSGCIVITTPRANLWYYRTAPLFYVKDWSELTRQYLSNILHGDTSYSQRMINKYYADNLSEEAVANFVLKTIQ